MTQYLIKGVQILNSTTVVLHTYYIYGFTFVLFPWTGTQINIVEKECALGSAKVD